MQCPRVNSRNREGKLRAAAVVAVVALVSCAAVACSSGEAEHAAAGAEVKVVSGSNSPASQTTPDQTPSRFLDTERFESPLNGLSIGYPSGWRTRAATEPWTGHSDVAFGAPDVDLIFHPTLKEDLYFAVVSEPLGGTSGPDSEWVRDMEVNLPSVGICEGTSGGGGGDDRLRGNYGWFWSCDTPYGSDSVGIVATATRGYIINLHVGEEPAAEEAADRIARLVPAKYIQPGGSKRDAGAWWWAMLQTVAFEGTEMFESPLNGLSISYPSGWRTRAATEPWTGHSDVAFGAPDVDVIFHPKLKDDLYLAIVSEALGGTSGSDWVDSGSWLTSVGICTDAYGSGGGSGTFHGNSAWFESCGTPHGGDGFVVFGTAMRGYIINLHVGEGRAERAARRILQATYGRDWFEGGILETVELPQDALDASNPLEPL